MDPPPEGVVDVPHAPESLVPVAHLQVHLRGRDMKLLTFFCKEFDVKFESAVAALAAHYQPRELPTSYVSSQPNGQRHFDD